MIETKDGTITGTFPELFENKRTQHSKYRIQILKFNEKHLKNPEGEPKFDVIFETTVNRVLSLSACDGDTSGGTATGKMMYP